MKKLMNICVILLMGMVFLSATTKANAASMPRLVDDANLLEDYEKANVLDVLDDISEELQFDIVVVTVDSTGGKSMRAYADDFFDYNGYGMGDNFDGALLLVNMNAREWYISTTGYGMTALSDRDISNVGEEVAEYLSYGEYEYAFTTFANLVEEEVWDARDGESTSVGEILMRIPIALLIGGGLAFIPVTVMKKKMNNVKMKNEASDYVQRDRIMITDSRDIFLYRTISRARIQKSSGGSSSHRGSSGRSHGGGGGRF